MQEGLVVTGASSPSPWGGGPLQAAPVGGQGEDWHKAANTPAQALTQKGNRIVSESLLTYFCHI